METLEHFSPLKISQGIPVIISEAILGNFLTEKRVIKKKRLIMCKKFLEKKNGKLSERLGTINKRKTWDTLGRYTNES